MDENNPQQAAENARNNAMRAGANVPWGPNAPNVPGNQWQFQWYQGPGNQFRHPTQGWQSTQEAIAGNHLANFAAAPQRLVDTVNNGFANYQQGLSRYNDRIDRNNNRRFALEGLRSRERMFNGLASALLGGAGQPVLQGLRDTNSGLRVGGNVSTNVTAQPLSLGQIMRADNAIRNTAVANNSPSRQVTPEQQAELNQLMAGRLREIAPDVGRDLTAANGGLRMAIQGARSGQFQGLAQLMNALQGDRIARQGANVRTLMQMIG